jgi:DNA-binding CsgD family transcriptional regulator
MHVTGDSSLFPQDVWGRISDEFNLSSRELQIIQLILEDEKEFAIAQRLGISIHTVHTHLERLYHKLGVSSRVQLVVCLMRMALKLLGMPGSILEPICGNRSAGQCPLAN